MSAVSKFFRRGEGNALLFALVWSIALVLTANYTPMFEGEGRASTFVAVNGTYGALMAAMPVVLSIATIIALRMRGRRRAGPMAWMLAILCAALSLVTILSVGVLALPVVGCLMYACAVHGRPYGERTRFVLHSPFARRSDPRAGR